MARKSPSTYRPGTVRAWATDMLFPGLIPKVSCRRDGWDDKIAGTNARANEYGEPLPPERMPERMASKRAPGALKLRPYFSMNGWPAVRRAAHDVLRDFDLGAGSLYPVRTFERDGTTPLIDPATGERVEVWVWNLGNVKNTFVVERSPGVSENDYVPGIWHASLDGNPNEIALSENTLTGPDVWVEANLRGPVFLSGPLGDALLKAGVGRHMMMQPVVVGDHVTDVRVPQRGFTHDEVG